MKRAVPSKGKHFADFDLRKGEVPEGATVVEGKPWEYILVHPVADDTENLERLRWSPERCRSVDCYWRTEHDVFLLRVVVEEDAALEAGLYACLSPGEAYSVNLVAVVHDTMIRRADIEEAMEQFAAMSGFQTAFRGVGLDKRLRRVSVSS